MHGLNQPRDATAGTAARRRPSPLGDWAGSTVVVMVEWNGVDPLCADRPLAALTRHDVRRAVVR